MNYISPSIEHFIVISIPLSSCVRSECEETNQQRMAKEGLNGREIV